MDSYADMPDRFSELSIGDSFSFEREITADMIAAFAELSGDYNPVHMDEGFCVEHGLGSRIAHGMLVLSLVSTLIGMYLPGNGAVWLSQKFDFISPARIGDVLTVLGTVTGKESRNMLGMGILDIKVVVRNRNNAVVVRGTVKVSIK
jgi:3-oxoacyl-[acyl-carrier protein] reductase